MGAKVLLFVLAAMNVSLPVASQPLPADPPIDKATRAAVIERLTALLDAGYVAPEEGRKAIGNLRSAHESGQYEPFATAKPFAEKLTADLRAATHDKHIAVYFDRAVPSPSGSSAPAVQSHERFNFGFGKVERLRGNVGYLDLRSFANLDEGREAASAYLDALANFDAIIIDLRQNGGGNTPMAAYIASYFFGPKPVHFTDMYWRDQNQTVEIWTSEKVQGRRSADQPLYLLVGASTFSAAEDFAYSLQQLKRATIVGGITGGGAHMGRGLQRLSPLFTAFIPVGQSLNPITKTNWEGLGVQPDIKVAAKKALTAAHLAALRGLAAHETDTTWGDNLLRTIEDLTLGK